MWRIVAYFAAVFLMRAPVALLAQNPGTPAPVAKPQFFGGTVTEFDETHITVSRKLVGHSPESRTFLIDANTKMNKATIHIKGRVTVRYMDRPEDDLALEIQARPPSHPKAP